MSGKLSEGEDFALFGRDLFGAVVQPVSRGPLADRFEFPPFSVLSSRDGFWQERKRSWLGLGLRSEIGRSTKVFTGARIARGADGGMAWGADTEGSTVANSEGVSVFDPVLCELVYRWFCPPAGQVLDPFAGGSVRGIVAGLLGFRYHGIDLRAEQVAANESQRQDIAPDSSIAWACGDSLERLAEAPEADFIFSCPPYGDLERYSDDPADLSTMEYHTFLAAYRRIILRCIGKLKPNRFACFVVGDFRDKRTGNYRGFVADTINAFREMGMPLYNDAVFVTPVGSLPVRVGSQFSGSRKLGKTHQNVLVFAKGDPRLAFAETEAA